MSATQSPSVTETARRAKAAAAELAPLPGTARDGALLAIADALTARKDELVAANALDIDKARTAGTEDAIVDRLTLTPERIAAIASDVRDVVALPDPVGEVVRGSTLPGGLELRQVRVPLGVVGIVYEARPNVTVDAAALCLKSGNAVLLRGSSSAYSSNSALVGVLREAVTAAGLPADAVQLVPGESRDSVKELMRARGLVDVLIPRGGASLIKSVVEESTVPVIETGVGNCHVYVDESADLGMAVDILVNSKAQRPSVCNAAETVLVHAGIADAFLPRALEALADAGVTVHGDAAWQKASADVVRGHRGGLGHRVPLVRHRRRRRALPGRGRAAHPRVDLGSYGGDRHPRHRRRAPLHLARRFDGRDGERLHPLHGRRPVRIRCGDRHLDAETARARADGPARSSPRRNTWSPATVTSAAEGLRRLRRSLVSRAAAVMSAGGSVDLMESDYSLPLLTA